ARIAVQDGRRRSLSVRNRAAWCRHGERSAHWPLARRNPIHYRGHRLADRGRQEEDLRGQRQEAVQPEGACGDCCMSRRHVLLTVVAFLAAVAAWPQAQNLQKVTINTRRGAAPRGRSISPRKAV